MSIILFPSTRSWECAPHVGVDAFPLLSKKQKNIFSRCVQFAASLPKRPRAKTNSGAKMGIDSTTETLESYFHPDSSKDMKLQERQTIVVVVFIILLLGGFVFYIVAEVMERRGANAKNANMNKAKLSPTPKNAPVNRFRDSKGGRLDTSVLRTSAAGTDVIV